MVCRQNRCWKKLFVNDVTSDTCDAVVGRSNLKRGNDNDNVVAALNKLDLGCRNAFFTAFTSESEAIDRPSGCYENSDHTQTYFNTKMSTDVGNQCSAAYPFEPKPPPNPPLEETALKSENPPAL